jgi:uncharacterized protein (TIGR02246 family)
VLFAAAAGLAAVIASATTVIAQTDPLAVYHRYLDASSRGDAAAVADIFAEDGVFVGGGGCRPTPCVGKAAIRQAFENIAAAHQQVSVVATEVSGNTVAFRAEAVNDSIRAAGLERILSAGTAEVRGDRIAELRALPDPSDPQTARYLAWQAAQTPAQTPAALPRAGSATAGRADVLAVVLGCALVAGGYALRCRRRSVAARRVPEPGLPWRRLVPEQPRQQCPTRDL